VCGIAAWNSAMPTHSAPGNSRRMKALSHSAPSRFDIGIRAHRGLSMKFATNFHETMLIQRFSVDVDGFKPGNE